MDEDLQRQLETAFPAYTDAEIFRGAREGILLADDLLENTPLLRTRVGRDLRGHVRRAGIMFRVQDLCARGDIPFQAEIVRMPHGHWHWLEIRSVNFKAHICRTDGTYEFPDDTLSRQDERLVNQGDLFAENVIPIGEYAAKLRVLYAWLTFGAGRDGSVSHLCWAMPPADDGYWLAHVNVLERVARTASSPKEPEVPTSTLRLKFREEIEEALSGQDDEEQEEDK